MKRFTVVNNGTATPISNNAAPFIGTTALNNGSTLSMKTTTGSVTINAVNGKPTAYITDSTILLFIDGTGSGTNATVSNGVTITFSGNKADNGGAVYAAAAPDGSDSSLQLGTNANRVQVISNRADKGGAVYVSGNATISGGQFGKAASGTGTFGNYAEYGAGIYIDGGSKVSVTNAVFSSNESSEAGGGVYISQNVTGTEVSNAVVDLKGSVFSANTAKQGAGLYSAGTYVTVENGSFTGNTAEQGGGVYNSGSLTLKSVTIGGAENAGNKADLGGGVYTTGSLSIKGSTISQNTAEDGGALYLDGASASFIWKMDSDSGNLNGNTATRNGGMIYNNGGTVTIGPEQGTSHTIGYFLQGNTDSAQYILSNLEKVEPDHVGVLLGLADCYFHNNMFDKGITYLKKVLVIEPDNIEVYDFMIQQCLIQCKVEMALHYFKKRIALKSDDDEEFLSRVNNELMPIPQVYEAALKFFEAYLEINPYSSHAWS